MIARIHYTVGDETDWFVVSGKDAAEIREKATEFFNTRGLREEDVDPWAEMLDEVREE